MRATEGTELGCGLAASQAGSRDRVARAGQITSVQCFWSFREAPQSHWGLSQRPEGLAAGTENFLEGLAFLFHRRTAVSLNWAVWTTQGHPRRGNSHPSLIMQLAAPPVVNPIASPGPCIHPSETFPEPPAPACLVGCLFNECCPPPRGKSASRSNGETSGYSPGMRGDPGSRPRVCSAPW